MRVWLYSRLSRDEDAELNSLTNQQKILLEYAENNGYEIVGESADDNISGMHFNREGINEIYNAVENKKIDAVIVKDLSRLGRHRTQTALFIDYLRENDVRVLSVTENIDTSNEDDDLMVGFKGVFNDMYARDISKKIRAGYKQKQKAGIILIPPMGYYKDKNTGEVVVLDEAAEIVRRIYRMFLNGYGMKNIAHILNSEGIKSAGYYQNQTIGKKHGYNKPEIAHRYLWNASGIKRILTNEFYIGTLVCHKSYTSKINHIRKEVPEEERFVHENFVPAIISKETFDKVQKLIENKKRTNVRASSGNPYHRYTGLLKCADCGSVFVCKIRRKNSPDRYYEYICNGYHRYGKEHCTSHMIRESDLDKIIYDELENIRVIAQENCARIDADFRRWKANKGTTQRRISELKAKLEQRQQDQQDILLERIRDKSRAFVYTQMLEACESDIKKITKEIENLKDIETTVNARKKEIKSSIEALEQIAKDGTISDSDLRLLVEKIEIAEKDGKLDITVILNGNFRQHIDLYKDGKLNERYMESWYQAS